VNPVRGVKKEEKSNHIAFVRLKRSDQIALMCGLLSSLFLAALDHTAIGPALPKIGAEAGTLGDYAWLVTAYMLISTLSLPISIRLSDYVGRKNIFLVGVGIFSIGSLWCGVSGQHWFILSNLFPGLTAELILARGIQGLGGGAILGLCFVIIGDMFSPVERARYQGLFSGIYGLGSLVGPAIGGWLVENFGWRSVFLINLPVGFIAVMMIGTSFPAYHVGFSKGNFDIRGMLYFCASIIPLLFACDQFARVGRYSVESGVLLALFVFMGMMFFREERRSAEAFMPFRVLSNRTVSVSIISSILASAAVYALIVYLPLYFQLVIGANPQAAGFFVIPLTMGSISGTVMAGQIMAKTGKFKKLALVATSSSVVSMAASAILVNEDNTFAITAAFIFFGITTGMLQPTYTVAVQNSVPTPDLGSATGALQLSRSIGGILGVALGNALLARSYYGYMRNNNLIGPGESINPMNLLCLIGQKETNSTLRISMASGLREAFRDLIFFGAMLMLMMLFISFLLPDSKLRKS
jgi:MFS family permease